MKRRTIAAGIAVAIAIGAGVAAGEPAQHPYSIGLGEFMLFTQSRHSKLWLAGDARNWDLAAYLVDELREGFEDAAKAFPEEKGTPIGPMIESLVTPRLAEVDDAIKARNRATFAAAFEKLTAGCNACHEALNRGYVVIQRPSASAFPNQSFAPRKK